MQKVSITVQYAITGVGVGRQIPTARGLRFRRQASKVNALIRRVRGEAKKKMQEQHAQNGKHGVR